MSAGDVVRVQTFEASGEGTRVFLEHRGFASLREGRPVRHGQNVVEFIGEMGRWWGSLVTSAREHAEKKLPPLS